MVNKINASYFVAPDDPVLVKKAKKVSPLSLFEVKDDVGHMLRVAYGEHNNDMPLLVGLAAPQVGISKRIILVDLAADGKGMTGDLRVFINPEITFMSSEHDEWYEGCFSTDCVCGIVDRPLRVIVKAITEDGADFEGEFEGYAARIFQHEIDHLNGIEFINHIEDDSKLHWVEPEEFPVYRNEGAWRTWPNKCPRSKWLKIKGR